MRHDMSKIIVEPARAGAGYYSTISNDYRLAKRFKLDEDGEVSDEFTVRVNPIRSRHVSWEGKSHRFAYNAVKRFLTTNIGLVWNDIYSEIAGACKTKAAKALNLRDLFMNNVEIHTFVGNDGYIYYRGAYRVEAACAEQEAGLFYVDPRDGTLRVGEGETYKVMYRKRAREDKAKLSALHREVGDLKFQKIDDVWFHVRTEIIKARYRTAITNVIWKRTVSKVDIRRYGLNNTTSR